LNLGDNVEQHQIEFLDQIGKEYGYEFSLPPFKENITPFFTVDIINDDMGSLSEFSSLLYETGYSFTINVVDGKKRIEVLGNFFDEMDCKKKEEVFKGHIAKQINLK